MMMMVMMMVMSWTFQQLAESLLMGLCGIGLITCLGVVSGGLFHQGALQVTVHMVELWILDYSEAFFQ